MISAGHYIKVNRLLEQDRSFAVYRLPSENRLRYVEQDSCSVSVFTDIESLNNQSGFVIAPFSISEKCPVAVIRGEEEIVEIEEEGEGEYAPLPEDMLTAIPSDYERRFHVFIENLQNNRLDKLVLSRTVSYERWSSFSIVDAFLKACRRYIRSYVYVYYTPETGIWLGGTPEILLSGEGGNWHTVALAGTQKLQQGKLPEHWNRKNLMEQQLVADYIRTRLNSSGIRAEEEGPYTVRAGELAHLKTDFRFSLPDNHSLGDLLKLLHPTPAVCGLPKEDAYRFILLNEGYNRRYYSGFVGMLNPSGRTDLYVNLRCMRVEADKLVLYAGGGLLSSSVLEEEWQETEEKLQTMNMIL